MLFLAVLLSYVNLISRDKSRRPPPLTRVTKFQQPLPLKRMTQMVHPFVFYTPCALLVNTPLRKSKT